MIENQIDDTEFIITTKHHSPAFELSVSLPRTILHGVSEISGCLMLTPLLTMINMPIQIELNGYSICEKIQEQNQENIENIASQKSRRVKSGKIQEGWQEEDGETVAAQLDQRQGEYFVEGDQTLYQLDELTQLRREKLEKGVTYSYPFVFQIPANLPPSLENHAILKELSVFIRYFFSISVNPQPIQSVFVPPFSIKLPLQLQHQKKQYPYQIQAIVQRVRVYHPLGPKKQKPNFSKLLTKCLCRCFCPKQNDINNYFVLMLQVTVSVHKHHLYINAKMYLDPQQKELTRNRMKSQNDSIMKLDFSVTSQDFQSTSVIIQQLLLNYSIDIILSGSLSYPPIQKQVSSSQIILKSTNSDILEGQCLIELDQQKSYSNELFKCQYWLDSKVAWNTNLQTKIEYLEKKEIIL